MIRATAAIVILWLPYGVGVLSYLLWLRGSGWKRVVGCIAFWAAMAFCVVGMMITIQTMFHWWGYCDV